MATSPMQKAIDKLENGGHFTDKELADLKSYYDGIVAAITVVRPCPPDYKIFLRDCYRNLVTIEGFISARHNR